MKNFLSLLAVVLSTGSLFAQQNTLTFAIGSFEVSILSEGHNSGNSSLLIGATPEILQKYAPDGTFPMATNAYLVRTPDKNILVDAGYGRNLFDHLKSLKTDAGQIHVILLTHMHGDHIGGLLKDGKPAFPNAELYLSQVEHDYWTSDEAMNKVAENRRGGFRQARDVINAYSSKLHLFASGDWNVSSILPGVQGIAAYGHTPGHTAFLLNSNESRLLIWGDLTHAMSVQMPHPEVALSFDVEPAKAIASRKVILEYVAENKIPIAGMHIVSPGMGDIKKSDDGYTFTPFCLCRSL
jgi:glyoxylase-like metal-dependent hydrolase (beta-lactamase superfamily II)